MTYYTKVSYYDEPSETEEYGSFEEAAEAFASALSMNADCVLGDVEGISYGKFLPHGKRKVFQSIQFA